MFFRFFLLSSISIVGLTAIFVFSYEQMSLEDTHSFYQASHERIKEIDKELENLAKFSKFYTDQQTSPLKQERTFVCSKLFHAVSFYNVAPEKLKLDKKLPIVLNLNFCLRG